MYTDNNKKIICLENISKTYRMGNNKVTALNNINFSVMEKEFVAIIGRSGSGKTTLMNLLGCLDYPDCGSYWLDGENVSGRSDAEISGIRNKKIGFIFQSFNLIENLTAIQNVELPLIYRKIPKSKRKNLAIKALEKVSLSERMSHRPCELSGGQQQRVAIARALAAQPPIILADEPTGNLDSRSSKEVMRILHAMNRAGATVILITHDDSVAKEAGRVITISDGTMQILSQH